MLKRINGQQLAGLSEAGRGSPRGRAHFNLHSDYQQPVQRLLNAIEPLTYVQPHRHLDPGAFELFAAVRGRAGVLTFDADGAVIERVELAPAGEEPVVEIPVGVWHTLFSLQRDTVVLEIKAGPYDPSVAKDFAPWAPPEGAAGAAAWASFFAAARPGQRHTRESPLNVISDGSQTST